MNPALVAEVEKDEAVHLSALKGILQDWENLNYVSLIKLKGHQKNNKRVFH